MWGRSRGSRRREGRVGMEGIGSVVDHRVREGRAGRRGMEARRAFTPGMEGGEGSIGSRSSLLLKKKSSDGGGC